MTQSDIIISLKENRKFHKENDEIKEPLTITLEQSYNLELLNCSFQKDVKILLAGRENYQLNFSGSTFMESVKIIINNNNSTCIINISSANLKGFLQIESNNIQTEIIGVDTIFHSKILLDNGTFNKLNFQGITSENFNSLNVFSLKNTRVINEFLFHKANINKAFFDKSRFDCSVKYDLSKFKSFSSMETHFKGKVFCTGTCFGKRASFNGCNFDNEVIFIRCNENSVAGSCNFAASNFSKNSYFNLSFFSSATFANCTFDGVASFKDTSFNDVDFERCFFGRGADFANTQYKNGDRETFRLIKNEILKINNKFESLYYHAKELREYEKDLSYRKRPSEKLMLLLNRISTNHGLSWARGLLFTITISVIFFSLYLLCLNTRPFNFGWVSINSFFNACNITFQYFIRFITITHDFDFMKDYSPNGINFLIDFTSKIFIGYGIYQTIQAFRKYGKSN